MRYQHVFFDLDHTLWDFRTNSRATLHDLYDELDLGQRGVPDAAALVEVYEGINAALWAEYESGRIPKAVLRVLRFRNTLRQFGVNDNGLSEHFASRYLESCPKRSALNPGALDLLQLLARDQVNMHIITNGFSEVQEIKLRSSGIAHFFDVVLTSEGAQAKKPDRRIFDLAMKRAGADPLGSLMIGDDPVNDVRGAMNAGMDQVHYLAHPGQGPEEGATFVVEALSELPGLLGLA
ncbi:MAG: YjjG family noncanonical pyrimidine nucleotidase [Flavobacteriales bacterium]|nr:YjjG family noncanonical pyrimidine nucleotidase [Flavobacteriales bacterium]